MKINIRNLFRTKYRIVWDSYDEYTTQAREWWFPVWMKIEFSCHFATLERAHEFIERYTNPSQVVEEFYIEPKL